MKQEYKHKLLLPQKLMTWFVDIEQQPPKITGFSIERMQYIVSTIVKHPQDKHPGAYSLLNMRYLENIVPGASKYIQYLKKCGIIEYKNYMAGRNSRLYRLCKQHDGPTVFRTVTDNRFNRRIVENYNRMKLRNSKKYPMLNSYVYAVSIDYAEAMHTIDEHYNLTYQEDPMKAEAHRTYSLAEVDKINAKSIYIRVNATNGRYDTNFTRLPSELVPHLKIDGLPLTEIDIRNSQPFFAVALFNPSPEVEAVMNDYLGSRLTMYIKSMQLSQFEDVKLYTSLVTSGTFYEFMLDKFKLNGIEYPDRAAAKEAVFTIYFGKNSAVNYSSAVKLFRSLFPNVYRLFEAIKEKEHNRLAILLQRIESHIILDIAAQRVLSELPDVKFITKHDSILPAGLMVTDNVAEVSRILIEVVTEVVGAKPLLSIKTARASSSSSFSSNRNKSTPSQSLYPLCSAKPCKLLKNKKKKRVGL